MKLQQSFVGHDCLNCIKLKSKRTASKEIQTQFTSDLLVSNSSVFVTEMENDSLKDTLRKLQKKYELTKRLCVARGEENESLKKEMMTIKSSRIHSEVSCCLFSSVGF